MAHEQDDLVLVAAYELGAGGGTRVTVLDVAAHTGLSTDAVRDSHRRLASASWVRPQMGGVSITLTAAGAALAEQLAD